MTVRRFEVHRPRPLNDYLWIGPVADGVEWPDGSVTIRWHGPRASIVQWRSMGDARAVHEKDGLTQIVWVDP